MLFSLNLIKLMGNFYKVFAAYKQVRGSTALLHQIAGILLLLSNTIHIWYLSKDSDLTVPKIKVALSNGICLRWYRTHQHMSKKLPSFDMLKNSSKLIYFDKNNRTLPCFLKSY